MGNLNLIILTILLGTAYPHLWFIPLIIQFYLLYPLIDRVVYKYKKNLSILLIISIIIQIIWTFGRIFLSDLIGIYCELPIISFILLRIIGTSFLNFIAYFMLGIYICKNYDKIIGIFRPKKNYIILISIIILFILININFSIIWFQIYSTHVFLPYINQLIKDLIGLFFYSIITIFLLKLSIDLRDQKNIFENIISKFGQYSFGIYLIHMLIRYFTIKQLDLLHINYEFWYYYIICFIIVASGSLFITFLIGLLPHHEILIGNFKHLKTIELKLKMQ